MTQFQKLQQVVTNPKEYGLSKSSNAYKSLKRLSECGKSYTARSTYSLGWATKKDWTSEVEMILNELRIAYEVRNDSPRGGANGKHIVLTGKAILSDIVKADELRRVE